MKKKKKKKRKLKKMVSENCKVLHVIKGKEKERKKLNMVVSIPMHEGPDSN
jgi:hypothetical protein